MAKLLEAKVVLVTGASSGIGRAIAVVAAREGAKLVLSDIDDAAGEALAEELTRGGAEAIYKHADSASPSDNEALVDAAVAAFGRLDVAVNNAGIGGPAAKVEDYPIDGWDKVIAINLSGVFYGMRYQIPAMRKSGGGSIINMASVLGRVGFSTSSAYSAAKHGIVGLTQSSAIEYGTENIRVNAVGPGFIRTPLVVNSLSDAHMEALKAEHAMGRLGESEEVAELVVWLASERASFVTGSYYAVDGGYLAM